MQYFKHMTNMRHDIKIDRIIDQFGLEGYGLYCLILECISEKLTSQNPYPDLEETAADISRRYKIDIIKCEKIMLFCIDQNLFDQDEITGRLVCHKVYKFLDTSMTGSPELRKMILKYKKNIKDKDIMTYHEGIRTEEKRREEKRKEKNKYAAFVSMTKEEYNKLLVKYGKSQVDILIEKLDNYKGEKGKRYKSDYRAILNWVVAACKVIEKENNNKICKICKKKYDYSPDKDICCDCLRIEVEKENENKINLKKYYKEE